MNPGPRPRLRPLYPFPAPASAAARRRARDQEWEYFARLIGIPEEQAGQRSGDTTSARESAPEPARAPCPDPASDPWPAPEEPAHLALSVVVLIFSVALLLWLLGAELSRYLDAL